MRSLHGPYACRPIYLATRKPLHAWVRRGEAEVFGNELTHELAYPASGSGEHSLIESRVASHREGILRSAWEFGCTTTSDGKGIDV